MDQDFHKEIQKRDRRSFLSTSTLGLGALSLSLLGGAGTLLGQASQAETKIPTTIGELPHHIAKAKRVIFLFQAGGPSQMDLFDHKPILSQRHGEEMPKSIRGKQRVSGMTASQGKFPITASHFSFQQYGESRAWISELLPYTAQVADDLCFVKSMHTNAINHTPGVSFFQTGSEQSGRPSFGSWVSYGLGSDNEDLPAFVVLLSRAQRVQITLNSSLWSNGFLPTFHQGVQFRSGKDPVLYLNNPAGIDRGSRRKALDLIKSLNEREQAKSGDPEIESQIAQYEMAYRMQTSVPGVVDISNEPPYILDMYGKDAQIPGTYAANCLLARRLAEQGVKFIQLYHMGWDHHSDLPSRLQDTCRETDQASAALVKDLKQRGLWEDTLIVWGGEFGRTAFSQGTVTPDNYGRDHHPRCFTVWLSGGGIKPGISYGETDDFSYNIVKDPVHVHDLQATLLHQLGLDHERLTFKHQGRRYRLTDVHGQIVKGILS